MGANVNYSTINYRDQQQFDYFFATAFDRYDRNRDGRIDYREFQPLINDMCNMIIQKYGNGPTVDKIRQAWYAMDRNQSGYITWSTWISTTLWTSTWIWSSWIWATLVKVYKFKLIKILFIKLKNFYILKT